MRFGQSFCFSFQWSARPDTIGLIWVKNGRKSAHLEAGGQARAPSAGNSVIIGEVSNVLASQFSVCSDSCMFVLRELTPLKTPGKFLFWGRRRYYEIMKNKNVQIHQIFSLLMWLGKKIHFFSSSIREYMTTITKPRNLHFVAD